MSGFNDQFGGYKPQEYRPVEPTPNPTQMGTSGIANSMAPVGSEDWLKAMGASQQQQQQQQQPYKPI